MRYLNLVDECIGSIVDMCKYSEIKLYAEKNFWLSETKLIRNSQVKVLLLNF